MARTRFIERAPQDEALSELPAPIQEKLHALVRRVRRIQILRGCLATLAVAIIATIILMAVGATFTILSPALNAALSGLGLAAIIACAFRTLFRPLRKPLSESHMARVIEHRHPELHERISTAIELLGGRDHAALDSSDQLLSKVVESATADAESFRPKQEFTNRTSRRYLIALAAGAIVLALIYLLAPSPAGRLLTRVVAPFAKVGNAYAERLSVDPGDSQVAEGDPLVIHVAVDGTDTERAEIRRAVPGGPETVESLSLVGHDEAAGTTTFAITFPAISESFSYRIRSGRAVSDYYDVIAAKRPEIRRLELSYEPPAYTGLPPLVTTGLGQSIETVTGTKVQIRAHFDRPLESAVLKIDGNPMPASDDQSGEAHNPRATWNFDLAAGTDGKWRVDLLDRESVSNRSIESPIRAIPDLPPKIHLLSEQDELRIRPDERLTLRYEVDEDFGLSAASLKLGGLQSELPQELPTRSGNGRYSGAAVLDLAQTPVPAGGQPIQVFVVVEDNRPQPQTAMAGPITITLDPDAGTLAEQAVDRQQAEMRTFLAAAIEKLQMASALAEPIVGQLVRPDLLPLEVLAPLASVRTLIGEAESLVHATAAVATSQASLFHNLAPGLASVITEHIVPARRAAEEIPLTDAKVTRVHRAHKVVRRLALGIADLEAALSDLKQQSFQVKAVAQMGQLNEKQRRLAKALAETGDPEDQQGLRDQQAALAKALGQLAEESRRPVSDHLQDARHDASSLAEFADSLARKQAALAGLLESIADLDLNDQVQDMLIIRIESEQREIGDALDATEGASRERAESAADAIAGRQLEEAARRGRELEQSLAGLASAEDSSEVRERIGYLAAWEGSLAGQLEALADGKLDLALALRQEFVAKQAEELALRSDRFRQQAEALADPSALEQLHGAGAQARQAARSARQASSELDGQTSTGAFEFARSPDGVAEDQNRDQEAPPGPTQAGVEDPSGSGEAIELPFSDGEVAIDDLPPAQARSSGAMGGGTRPPETGGPAPMPPELVARSSAATGQTSIVSAAQRPARQAQRELAGASDALSDAAGSFAQQASRPGLHPPEEINQQMLEAARLAAQLALEQDPEILGKLAAKFADTFATPAGIEVPTPAVRDWQSIRGSVKSGVTSTRKGAAPDGYRELINRYFKEIARLSNESSNAQR